MKMENFFSLEDGNYNVTSEHSSDESFYYSASSSPDLSSFEELNNYAYLSETDSLSVYSENFGQAFGQITPTVYPATANLIEVLGIFPVEVRGTTFYQPLFYYVPVHSDLYRPLSPDVASEQYETETTEYCSTESETDTSSLSSDTYYTAEESESCFDSDEYDYATEEFGYFNESNVELSNLECSPNDDFDLSEDKQYIANKISKSNYEETDLDDVEQENEVNSKTVKSEYLPNYESNKDNGHCRSENSASACDEECYKDILPHADNIFEKKGSKGVGDFNSELYSDRNISERRDFSKKCSTHTFEFGDVNNINCQKQGLKKCNTFEDLSGSKRGQYLRKHDSLGNLSRFEDNEMYEEDFQCDTPEIGTDNYECETENLSFDPDDFEFTEEEVKNMKDQIYLRALSGKLYQKTHIPSVAVLPTIYEENECCCEMNEQQVASQGSCLTKQGHLNDSLCNLYETSSENGEASEKSQQKPKKKKMERIREFLARIFCCVKPP